MGRLPAGRRPPTTRCSRSATQRNGAFQGLYNLQDTYDGTWREREGYDDKQFFEAETERLLDPPINVQFSKKAPDETDFAPIAAFVAGVRLTGNAQRDYLLANADLPQMINYAAVTAIIEHHDSSSKNFFLSQDPATGRWSILPWDLDHTPGQRLLPGGQQLRHPGRARRQHQRADARHARGAPVARHVLPPAAHPGQRPPRHRSDGGVYDARVGPAQSTATLDFAAWPYPNSPNYAPQRTRLFNDIQARRNVFANDARVPGNQPAAPDIVINEIQHSPTAATPPSSSSSPTRARRRSTSPAGRSRAASTLTVQPGTVILPGRR